MTTKFRNYTSMPGFTEDFHRVRDFLVRINQERVTTPGFLWARWEWMFSQPLYYDFNSLSKIGVWQDCGDIVALATYESGLGNVYFCIDEKYNHIKKEMLVYARANLQKNGEFHALISDADREFQKIAVSLGLRPTQEGEHNSVFDIDVDKIRYCLPTGYRIISMADDFDLFKYTKVLWRGFDHGDEPREDKEYMSNMKTSISGPDWNPSLQIAVVSPDDEYVSYCGMWYDEATSYALVEPVATDPAHRMKGLGKAAVLEAIKRCGLRGAKQAYVGARKQFYYQIGFYPVQNNTWWA